MRLSSFNLTPHISTDTAAHRPVVLRWAGLRFTLTIPEAHALADELHDTADRIEIERGGS